MKKKSLIWIVIIPTLLILLNILIKGFFLGSNSVAGDEPFSIYIAQMDISSIIKHLSTGNNPPLYEIILHFWIKIFGISSFSVRFPSLIFSSIAVIFIYRLGLKHINNKVATYASLLFTFSNYHILFAHESRVYTLLGMLSVMSMYYFLNLISKKKTSKKQSYIGYIIVSILLIYAHYFGFLILIAQLIFLVMNRAILKKYWKQILFAFSLLLLLYTPNILVIVTRLIDSTSNGTWVKYPIGIEAIYSMLRTFSNAPVVTVITIIILISAAVKYFFTKKDYQPIKQSSKLVIIWFIFIFFFMFAISFIAPIFLDRYMMPSAIAFPLLTAIAADFLIDKKRFRFMIPSIICILFIATVKPDITNRRHVKEAVEKVISLKKKSTLVYICPSWYQINFTYYYDRVCFENYSNKGIYDSFLECLSDKNIHPINQSSEMTDEVLSTFSHVIFLDAGADFTFPNNGIVEKLSDKFKLRDKFEFYEIFKIYNFISVDHL